MGKNIQAPAGGDGFSVGTCSATTTPTCHVTLGHVFPFLEPHPDFIDRKKRPGLPSQKKDRQAGRAVADVEGGRGRKGGGKCRSGVLREREGFAQALTKAKPIAQVSE